MRHSTERISDLINKFDLGELKNRPVYSLSTGQQVRVSLAKAFLNRPRLLLLDEPTSSLDPDVADRVRSFLINVVKEEKTTVFLTSHNMAEVEKVCTRVLFLNEGKIQAEGTPRELARRITRWKIHIKVKNGGTMPALATPEDTSLRLEKSNLDIETDRANVGPFLTDLIRKGIEIETISIHEPTLEDFFVRSARESTPSNDNN
jgi:ABC-2 type transport system ATP-binding protein